MYYLDLTFPTAEENLACDEALLEGAEEGTLSETLRFWEPQDHFVVVGYSNKVKNEVRLSSCESRKIPVYRRVSGGGTVLQGPGCLNYALILQIPESGPLSSLTATNDFIMQNHQKALQPLLKNPVSAKGTCDLTIADLKFSGNAQRRKKKYLLYHGTFLLNFDLNFIEEILSAPARQPEYRNGRSHLEFVMNLGIQAKIVKQALRNHWHANLSIADVPHLKIKELVTTRYTDKNWNYKF